MDGARTVQIVDCNFTLHKVYGRHVLWAFFGLLIQDVI
jgi:hypothetical protein